MEHAELSRLRSFPSYAGGQNFPDDLREAISTQAVHPAGEIGAFRKSQMCSLRSVAGELNAEMVAVRKGLSKEEFVARAKIHTPLLATPLGRHALGGRE